MVNRRAFFEIFFYNRENRSREMMEAAESVWRAYMKKYGLGLDAGSDGQPTYDEVREITYLANAAIEAVEKQIAEAEAEEARRKKLQREAWDLGIFAPDTTGVAELEAMVLKAMKQQEEPEDPVLAAVSILIREQKSWKGTATELLSLLLKINPTLFAKPNSLVRKLNAKTKELSDRYGIRYATQRAENVKYLILEAVSDNTDMCDISDIRPGA